MDDRRRVEAWFADGTLLRPRDGGRADLVDVVRALAVASEVPGAARRATTDALAARIGRPRHLVFVLVDGLGCALLRALARPGSTFLRDRQVDVLHAVFPSTTAAALTSLATGEHPCTHAILGWWTHLAEAGITAEALPFIERFTRRPLGDLGLQAADVMPLPSLMPRFRRRRLVVTRTYIAHSTYSRWWSGDSDSVGYDRIPEAIDRVVAHVAVDDAPSYTHLYLNQLDALCHEKGIGDPAVQAVFDEIDRELARLHALLDGRATIVLTADHGHVDRGADRDLRHDDPLMAHLQLPPSGEPRAPLFHVVPGHEADFAAAFRAAYGDGWALLSLAEAEQLRLLGPCRLAPLTRRRFGDFVALSPCACTIHYVHPTLRTHRNTGVHAGLTPDEIEVPLVLC